MNQITEAQINYIRSLAAKIEARVVAAPKKADRRNDPARAHREHIAKTREIIAMLDAGELTKAAAMTHIPSMKLWAGY